jgi:hypothetical protein
MADPELIKQCVIDLARKQVGSHYLWGAAGNTPGQSDGPSFRPSYTKLHANVPDVDSNAANGAKPAVSDVNVPTLFAAWADSPYDGKLACSGRCALLGKLPFALSGIVLNDALGFNLKNMTKEQIDEFKKNRKDVTKFRWPRPNGTLDKSGFKSTVWGESCIGVRHFDCIGLVNFCLTTILNSPWQFGIKSFTKVESLSKTQSCDIVTIGSEHIGIVTNLKSAIEAMDPGDGVVERPLTAAGWTQFWRLDPSTWKVSGN